MIKIALILFLVFSYQPLLFSETEEQPQNISINYSGKISRIEKNIFGSNLLGHDTRTLNPGKSNYLKYSNYGAGIWDPERNAPVEQVISLIKTAGMKMFRFPGGCGSHSYNWQKAIGENREEYLFGIDEFMTICDKLNVNPIIVISYFVGSTQDAVNLVKYLDKVRYFEFGNEIWHGNHGLIKKVKPEKYARDYLNCRAAIQEVNSKAQLGLVLYNLGYHTDWNKKVLDIVGENIDFVVTHTYPPHNRKIDSFFSVSQTFSDILFDGITRDEQELKALRKMLLEKTGRDNIGIAVTEYNVGLFSDRPIPYRHSLGAALVNAELLRIFMKPENHIIMANYWNFLNEFWGMVANGFNGNPQVLYKSYYKRPNYYVFELYNKHFGDFLLELVNLTNQPYLSFNASRKKDGRKFYLMVVNKHMNDSITITIELKDFNPRKEANAWVLNGPSIDATNEKKHDSVKVRHKKFVVGCRTAGQLGKKGRRTAGQLDSRGIQDQEQTAGCSFEYTFEPHSLTAIELRRNDKTE